MLVFSPHTLSVPSLGCLSINHIIVRNLGIIFDSKLAFESSVESMPREGSSSIYYTLNCTLAASSTLNIHSRY